jgi:hypothetical protein
VARLVSASGDRISEFALAARAGLTIGAANEEIPVTFDTLNVRRTDAVVFAAISAPPMNLLGPELVRDLVSLIQQLEADDAVQVLVLTSADPDYFISHVDVTRIAEYRQEAARLTGEASIASLFRHLSASCLVTIAGLKGVCAPPAASWCWLAICASRRAKPPYSVSSSLPSVRTPARAPRNTSRASWVAPERSRSC